MNAAGHGASEPSPLAQYRVLDLKLHVDGHRTRVDTRRVGLVARLHLGRQRRRFLGAVTCRGGRRRRGRRRQGRRDAFARQVLVHFLHVVLQLVQTLTEELVGILTL